MSEREIIAALYRRAAFGVPPGQLDGLAALGVDAVIDLMVDPGAHGIDAPPDNLWEGVDIVPIGSDVQAYEIAGHWADQLAVTYRPFQEWMAWYWHGHLVSGVIGAIAYELIGQINLYRKRGLGSFSRLLRDVTVDAAMLRYLDGDVNLGSNPNENFSREVLELFSLGVGNYTQDDIVAGAKALSGWQVDSLDGEPADPSRAVVRFVPANHDDQPQPYLGTHVRDVDSVVDAIVQHDACAPFVAARFGKAVLGPDVDPAVLTSLADRFRDSDLDLQELARATLEAVADGKAAPLIRGPFPWYVHALMVTSATLDHQDVGHSLDRAGHLPLNPPNVGGWPGGRTWLASSTTTERFNMAGAIVAATPADVPAMQAAREGDLDQLAELLSCPAGFTEPTRAALADLHDENPHNDGSQVLTVALASPDMVMA